jgi:REP element-mobilizing transposase RayT
MNDIQCLSHTKWDCKFHVIWIPKCRRKMIYGQLRKNLGEVFHDLARQKESRIVEGPLQPDHVYMLLLIPPKYSFCPCGWLYEREKRDLHCAQLPWTKEELQRDALLGTRVFCFNRWC